MVAVTTIIIFFVVVVLVGVFLWVYHGEKWDRFPGGRCTCVCGGQEKGEDVDLERQGAGHGGGGDAHDEDFERGPNK